MTPFQIQLFVLEMIDNKVEFFIYGFICLDFEMFVSVTRNPWAVRSKEKQKNLHGVSRFSDNGHDCNVFIDFGTIRIVARIHVKRDRCRAHCYNRRERSPKVLRWQVNNGNRVDESLTELELTGSLNRYKDNCTFNSPLNYTLNRLFFLIYIIVILFQYSR